LPPNEHETFVEFTKTQPATSNWLDTTRRVSQWERRSPTTLLLIKAGNNVSIARKVLVDVVGLATAAALRLAAAVCR
jgi:hypothetical protein